MGSEGVEKVVRGFDVAAGDPAPDVATVAGIDGRGIAYADGRHHGPEARAAKLVARIGGKQRDRGGEGARAERRIRVRRAAVPEGGADFQARARPLKPSGERG